MPRTLGGVRTASECGEQREGAGPVGVEPPRTVLEGARPDGSIGMTAWIATTRKSSGAGWARRCICAAALALVGSFAATTWAQAPVTSQPDAALTDKARDLYNEGRDHYVAGRIDRAHASFLASWALKRHWQIAGMLGECELKLGKHRDAAEHLAFALRSGANQAKPEEIAAMRVSFAEARKQVGELEIQVDRVGAEVLVDGAVIGRTPLTEPVYVNAGEHELEARVEQREGVKGKTRVDAGGTQSVALSFTAAAANVPGSSASTGPSTNTGPSGKPGDTAERPMWPAYVGAGVAVVGLGLGVGYTLAASGREDDRKALLASLTGANPCGPATPYGTECASVASLDSDARTDRRIALGGFVVGGVVAAGTVAYLLWPRHDAKTTSAMVIPIAGRDVAGLALHSSF